MKEKYIVICDREMLYACHLMEYLKSQGKLPMDICVYSEKNRMEIDCSPEETILLIIAESQYECQLSEKYERILILNESDRDLGEYPLSVSKYQSVEHILGYIRQLIPEDTAAAAIRHGIPMKTIGFYTPITRCLQTTMAMTMGQILAENGPVLYMNFEAYSGIEKMMGRSFRGTLSDLIYYNDCAAEKVPGALEQMTEEFDGLYLLPPMSSFVELQAIDGKQWKSFFETIERVTEYEYLILDLSENVTDLFEILRRCDLVYTITRKDEISQTRIKQYENLLQRLQYEDIYMKTIHCSFPVFKGIRSGSDKFRSGEVEEYLRRMMEAKEIGLQFD